MERKNLVTTGTAPLAQGLRGVVNPSSRRRSRDHALSSLNSTSRPPSHAWTQPAPALAETRANAGGNSSASSRKLELVGDAH